MKQAIFTATAAAVVALGATLAAAQSDQTEKHHSTTATEQHPSSKPEASTKTQAAPAQPKRDERAAGEEKRPESSATRQTPTGKAAQTPSAKAQPQPSQTERKPEERTTGARERSERGAVSQAQPSRERSTATERERTERGAVTQARPGAAAPAKAAGVSEQERARFEERFAAAPPHRVEHFGFRVSVGAAVPRSARLYALPPNVAAVVPQFRGYRYLADRDQIVIVEPATFRIVAVIPFAEGFMGAGPAPGVFRPIVISERERAEIRERIHAVGLHRLEHVTFRLAVGAFVPPGVRLYPMPPAVVEVARDLRFYRCLVVRDRFVVVEPQALRIVAIFPV